MSPLPRKASDAVRKAILDALKDRNRRYIDAKGPSYSWLADWYLKTDGLFEDLIDGLESSDNLFAKPKDPAFPQCYQCILKYPENGEKYPAIVVHVTLAPRGEPPRVRVAVHPSDTVRHLPPL
jgi:hypothetical protein